MLCCPVSDTILLLLLTGIHVNIDPISQTFLIRAAKPYPLSCTQMIGFNSPNAGLSISSTEVHSIGFPIILPFESCVESDFAFQYVNISPRFIFRNLTIIDILSTQEIQKMGNGKKRGCISVTFHCSMHPRMSSMQ